MYSIIMMIVMSGLSSACYALDAEVQGPAFAAHVAGAPAGAGGGAGVGAGTGDGAGVGGGERVPSLGYSALLAQVKQEIFQSWLAIMNNPDIVIKFSARSPKPASKDMLGFETSVMEKVLNKKDFTSVEDVEKVAQHLNSRTFHTDKTASSVPGTLPFLMRHLDNMYQSLLRLNANLKSINEADFISSDFLDSWGRPDASAPRARTIDPSGYLADLETQQGVVKRARNWQTASPFKRVMLKSEGDPHSGVGAEDGMVFNSKAHAPQLENNLPEIPAIPGPVTESPSERRKRESKNEKIREFNNARPLLLENAKNRFIRRPKSTPRKYFERADAFGVNTGILGDVADVLSFDSQNAKVMAAGAAASIAGRSADALYGRGAMSNSKTLEQERRLNRGLFGETEFNAEPTPPPAGENTEKAYKKADRRYEADQVSAGVSMLERQVAQPVLALYDHTNVALNAKATLAYNKFLAQNKNKPAVQKYLRRLRAKKGAIFAMMALETFLKSGAHWAHTRRETDPVVENPTKKDSKVVSNANTMAALGAAVGLARRGLTTYVKHKHVSAANDHADSLYDTDKENASEDDDMPVHQAVAGMTR